MYPIMFVDDPEKFLAQIEKLNVRFQNLHQDKSGNFLEAAPETGAGKMLYSISHDAVKMLSKDTMRIGTLLKLADLKLQTDGVMRVGKVSISDEENFKFEIQNYIGTKKGVHSFKGKASRIIPVQEDKLPRLVTVELTGKKAATLKKLFADKSQSGVSVSVPLRNLKEADCYVFRQTVDLAL